MAKSGTHICVPYEDCLPERLREDSQIGEFSPQISIGINSSGDPTQKTGFPRIEYGAGFLRKGEGFRLGEEEGTVRHSVRGHGIQKG